MEKELRWNWHLSNGIRADKLKWYKQEELAHYADAAFDIEYEFPFGWGEVEGNPLAYRFRLKTTRTIFRKKSSLC